MFKLIAKALSKVGRFAFGTTAGRAVVATAGVGGAAALATDSIATSFNENILQPIQQPLIDAKKGISTLSFLAIAGVVALVAFAVVKVVK